jgi:hypothetical protein
MKKKLMVLCALTLVFGMAASAQAIGFYKAFTNNVWFDNTNREHTWTFDLDASTDINAEDTINSAYFSIGFYDRWDWFSEESGNLTVDGVAWLVKEEIGFLDTILAANVTGLMTDHTLAVTVKRISGNFGVNFTSLFGDYTEFGDDTDNLSDNGAVPVPEPSTILLMGTGILGLVAYGRKRFNLKA